MAYERQYYTNGDVLDARQMNHMETGIKENSDNIDKHSEDIATKASAIKEKASGETIVVTDSDEAKPLGLAIDGKSEQNQYSGKNFFPYGDLSASKATNVLLEQPIDIPTGTYTFSMKTNMTDDIVTTITFLDANKSSIKSIGQKNSYWDTAKSILFELTSDCKYITIYVREAIELTQIQIESGSVMTDYEPYCGGKPSPNTEFEQEIRNTGKYDEASGKYAVEVEFTHKNLLENTGETKTTNGITFTVNKDKSISVKGTSTGASLFKVGTIKVKKGRTYICESSINAISFSLRNSGGGTVNHDFLNNGTTFTPTEDFEYTVYARVSGNITVDTTVYPMIRLSGVADGSYEIGSSEETTATVLLDEPLRKGDKAYWNGGSTITVERNRAVIVYDGSDDEKWGNGYKSDGINNRFETSNTSMNIKGYMSNIGFVGEDCLCEKFKYRIIRQIPNVDEFRVALNLNTDGTSEFHILFNPNTDLIPLEDLTAWKNYIKENPIAVEYTLATPITEEIDLSLDGLSMFYPTTILSNDCNANMEVEYIADTKAYIDKLKAKHESDITALKTAIVALGGTV